ncbi:23S rRNA (pseudouridine(1915)-N(3))-methyltransferase RlmH [Mesoplasma photuris]|uniref:23S rRNA (pseudouridine(1915)-N(3))-methyltransferase RlmH n=1 Tax=Mesoplasma photuris TaxID=217731 RepID=UPI0004E18511|nr:23S rRNA (pseudouridine(1915)-N(3))-methyltransferase RlmH [Mesoplasma photuris]
MKIKILCFGKLDEKYFIDASKEYLKRISKFADLEVIELKEEFKFADLKNREINSNSLMQKLESFKDHEVIVMDVASKISSSEDLAEEILNIKDLKTGKVIFTIGPSDGYSDDFKNKYKNKISFGKITLPHQLFRIILLEQIYRSFKINNNEKYHK